MKDYKHETVPFTIDVSGNLNGEGIEIKGTGVVPTIGIYKARKEGWCIGLLGFRFVLK